MNIIYGGNKAEQVINFKCIGSTTEKNGSPAKQVPTRTWDASNTSISSDFSFRINFFMFNSNILPFLSYVSETWYFNQEKEKEKIVCGTCSFVDYLASIEIRK